MFLNANNDSKLASKFEVVDLDTGKILEKVLWADDETGEYGQYNFNINGDIILTLGEPDLTVKRGNIKLREKK